jgi:hypothetical protein
MPSHHTPTLAQNASAGRRTVARTLRSLAAAAGLALLAACGDQGTAPTPDPRLSPADVRVGYILGSDGKPRTLSYEVHDGLAVTEGDIVVGRAEQIAKTPEELTRPGGPRLGVVAGPGTRWPRGVVPYVIDGSLSDPGRVVAAMAQLEAMTQRVTFVPRTTEGAYLRIVPKAATGVCWSDLGRTGFRQDVELEPGCTPGIIVHELNHALGMWHEQSRCDRDTYVWIQTANIVPASRSQFDKHCEGTDVFEYDEGSIMHYGSTAFGVRPGVTTIVSLRWKEAKMGQRTRLSPIDVSTLNWMYPGSGGLAYNAHVAYLGWRGEVGEGRLAGSTGLMRQMEALTLRAASGSGLGIAYQAHVAGIGWMPEVRDGRVAGTTGQGRQMEAVRIRLVNPREGQHVCYQAYVAGLRWLSPVCDGAVGGTTGQGRRMEALRVWLTP